MPFTVVAVAVPCSVAVPATRVAVITRPLSEVIKLPRQSCTRIAGCGAKMAPAVALEGGAVWKPKVLAPPEPRLMEGVVDCWIDGVVMSLAVTVALAPVVNVTARVLVPETSGAVAGRMALASLEARPTVSVAVVFTFQLASTALTVTLKAVPAVSAVGVPVLPVELPGDAVSPGTSSCSLANRPGLTGMAELVLMAIAVWVTFEAVTVWLPAVLNVTP